MPMSKHLKSRLPLEYFRVSSTDDQGSLVDGPQVSKLRQKLDLRMFCRLLNLSAGVVASASIASDSAQSRFFLVRVHQSGARQSQGVKGAGKHLNVVRTWPHNGA